MDKQFEPKERVGFGRRFFPLWFRWWLWITCIGVGFHAGQLAALAMRGSAATGAFIFATGVLAYAVIAVLIGAVVALIAAAFPTWKFFPTSLGVGALRVIVPLFLIGIGTIFSQPERYGLLKDTNAPKITTASSDRDKCLQGYATKHYVATAPACKRVALQYVPRLASMAQSNDMHEVLNTTWDTLRVTYALTFAYRENKDPENARQMALHSAGWGIIALGAMEQLDPKHLNRQYDSMRSEIGKDLNSLNLAYPGVVEDERKAIKEVAH